MHNATNATNATLATPVRIKVAWGYYANAVCAPADGYLMVRERYDPQTGRCSRHPLEFQTVQAARDCLVSADRLALDYDGNGQFSCGGTYYTAAGQHSRPTYTIVSRRTGRCTKAIVAECDRLAK